MSLSKETSSRLWLPALSKRDKPRRSPNNKADHRLRGSGLSVVANAALYLLNRRSEVAMSHLTSVKRILPPQDTRKALHHGFREISLIPQNHMHSHPQAASLRTSASALIRDVVLSAGMTPYYVSKSAREVEADGCRYYFMDKDLDKTFQDTPIRSDHVLVMIDVDYHINNIDQYLCYGNPIIMYTFVPTAAAGTTTDAVYTIEDNVVTYRVNGGAVYRHPLWKYEGDTVSVIDKYGSKLTYSIEQTQLGTDPQRRIIGFYPLSTSPRYTYRPDKECGIKRWSVCRPNGYAVVEDPCGGTISVAVQGTYHSSTISSAVMSACSTRMSYAGKANVGDVERILSAQKETDAPLKAPMIYDYLLTLAKLPHPEKLDLTCTTGSILPSSAVNFQAVGPLATEDGKFVGTAAAPSLLSNSAVFPARSHNNDVATITGRVTSIANVTQPPFVYSKYMDELINLLVPIPGVGAPISLDDVYRLQARPAQRARADMALPSISLNYTNKVKAFIKVEAYNNVTDPRNISTVDTAHQMHYSCYTLPFKEDVLARRKWYASDMDPTRIMDRVSEIASYPEGVILSDYSRLDGHISPAEKSFKERVYARWCNPTYRADLAKIQKQDTSCKGATKTGFKYNTGSSQLSGSPGTTPDNNLVTLLHDYVAIRELGYDIQPAWALIEKWVVGASDDRLRANLPGLAACVEEVCQKFGHILKSVVCNYNESIIFLGRVFPRPATHRASFQDPFRTMAKIHLVSCTDDAQTRKALRNKCLGYYVTDQHTPIIGAWCAKVISLTADVEGALPMTTEELYKFNTGPWPQESADVLYEGFANLVELDNTSILEIEETIKRARTIAELPEAVLDNGHTVSAKITAVLDGYVVHPDSKPCLTTSTHSANLLESEIESAANSEPPSTPPSPQPSSGTNTSTAMGHTSSRSTAPPSSQQQPKSTGCSNCGAPSPAAGVSNPQAPQPAPRGVPPTPAPRAAAGSPPQAGATATRQKTRNRSNRQKKPKNSDSSRQAHDASQDQPKPSAPPAPTQSSTDPTGSSTTGNHVPTPPKGPQTSPRSGRDGSR